MKILIGFFATEVNEHIPCMTDLSSYDLVFGESIAERMQLGDVLKQEGAEMIPSVYAKSSPNGIIETAAFETIENSLLRAVRSHRHEIDGIYLHLHGASYVEGIGSGDFHILKEVRKLVGPYLPIAVSCDPHGNLNEDYVRSMQILRSYRESPHTDMIATWQKTLRMLCELVRQRQGICPAYRKLPLILGGEQSVSADEPVRSINAYMNQLEQDPRIMSASWHVGYLRHDCPEAGCGVVVVPQTEADQAYADQMCVQLADFVWQRRREFHYTGITAEPEAALKMALDFAGKPFVLTDSGDNTTSGATGWNTFVLRQFLAVDKLDKRVLFAAIVDPVCVQFLLQQKPGAQIPIQLGMNVDALSQAVELNVELIAKGEVVRTLSFAPGEDGLACKAGDCVLVRLTEHPIDIIIANHKLSYFKTVQYEHAGVEDWTQYDIVVVKQGYIFPELKAAAQGYVMSLTDGATPQDTKHIPFKLVRRPMFPLDDMD
ncbi:M81 family metallopeptidase [Holdemania massiliensis]